MLLRKLAAGAALSVLALAATNAFAQETTGAVAGQVTENGKPVGGANVVVTNPANGQSVSVTTGGDGFYTVRNVPAGGPYNVTVTAPDKSTSTESIQSVAIGAPYELDISVGGESVSAVVVRAAPTIKNAQIATGPRTTFTANDIATLPSFGGDLHDLVRLNPFVTIDEANSNSLIIAGANNHFNTIYLDGVRQSDDFGLNNNGYPTQRSPFSLTVIQAMNLEIAPYDVQYGAFQGGILNVVTKSGSNDIHGSADFAYDSSQFSGKTIGGQALHVPFAADRPVTTKFQDQDSSVTIGGPIWKDHLFFFFGYDKYQGTGVATFTPSDVPGPNEIPGVTQANVTGLQAIISAATATPIQNGGYNYNPLNYGGTQPVTDTKYFGKLDWYINDNQHLFVSYQSTKGISYNVPDASIPNKELNLASSDYLNAQNLTAYTADLTSHWTPELATEVEYTYRDVETPSILIGAPFANFLVQFPSGGEIDLGPDISRQANNLGVIDQQAKIRAHYTLGDNVITAGYEWEQLSEFDLFVQDATGAYTFNNTCGPGIATLANPSGNVLLNVQDHVACKLFYQNAFDNNPNTAATTALNFTNTLYAEDEWHATPELTITGGLRFEAYNTPSKPLTNPRFGTQYGFSNAGTINGENILLPRIGFNWRPDSSLTITGGFGLFSGGNPGVYTYDSYDNPGNLLGSRTYQCTVMDCSTQGLTGPGAIPTGPSALTGVTGASIPTTVQADITASAAAGTGSANALAPGFKPPSTWKASLSVVKTVDFNDYTDKLHQLGWLLGPNWRFHADVLATKVQDAVTWEDLWEEQNTLTASTAALLFGNSTASPDGKAPDGRPIFNPYRFTCVGGATPPASEGITACPWLGTATTRTSGFDIELSDTTKGDSLIWALGFGKSWDWGLDFDYTYSHQNVRDINPATSSVASSNYINNISADPNHPALSTSNYQILYENKLNINFEHHFFGDNKTTFRLFIYDRAGLPFSYAFCPTASSTCASPNASAAPFDELFGQYKSTTMHQLLYVPKTDSSGNVTLSSDPKVTYGPSFDINSFNNFLHTSGLIKYNGQISPRNAFRSLDVASGDIQISQEVPGLYPNGAKGEFYLDVINVLNLLNKSWGIDSQVGFPYVFAPVSAINCQFSGHAPILVPGSSNPIAFPACAAGQGNYYQYNTFRPEISGTTNQFTTIQTLAQPPVPTWALKFGVRYKF